MGLYDIPYLMAVPNFTVTAPKDGTEMLALLRSAVENDRGPWSIRYPRDAAPDEPPHIREIVRIPYGTWDVLRKGQDVAILAVGTMVLPSLAAAELLARDGLNITVVNCRFLKPYDEVTLAAVLSSHHSVLVVEGFVPDQDTREKAILILGNVEGVGRVDDRLQVGRPVAGSSPSFGNVQSGSTSTASGPRGGGSQDIGHASAGGSGWTSTTYTVKKGDTLSEIAKETLGSANRYPEIFEANKPMLKDPDKIYPGQVLRIPKR